MPTRLIVSLRPKASELKCLALGPFLAHILRVVPLVSNPAELGGVGEFTEIEGQKRSSTWC